jgi:hypothetical protein
VVKTNNELSDDVKKVITLINDGKLVVGDSIGEDGDKQKTWEQADNDLFSALPLDASTTNSELAQYFSVDDSEPSINEIANELKEIAKGKKSKSDLIRRWYWMTPKSLADAVDTYNKRLTRKFNLDDPSMKSSRSKILLNQGKRLTIKKARATSDREFARYLLNSGVEPADIAKTDKDLADKMTAMIASDSEKANEKADKPPTDDADVVAIEDIRKESEN